MNEWGKVWKACWAFAGATFGLLATRVSEKKPLDISSLIVFSILGFICAFIAAKAYD